MHDKKITEYWLPWITKIMNQHIQGSGLQDAKKKKGFLEGEQAATCRRSLTVLRIWVLGKPY